MAELLSIRNDRHVAVKRIVKPSLKSPNPTSVLPRDQYGRFTVCLDPGRERQVCPSNQALIECRSPHRRNLLGS